MSFEIEQPDYLFSGLLIETGHTDGSTSNSLTETEEADGSLIVSLAMTGLTGHTEISFKVTMVMTDLDVSS